MKNLSSSFSIEVKPAKPDRMALVDDLADMGESRRTQRAKAENLTAREEEVLRLLSAGLFNKELAKKLAISTATLHTHLTHIYAKLHVRSRTEAVIRYLSSNAFNHQQ